MSRNIIVLEGADGTGKSTLSAILAKELKGSVIHATYNKKWDMEEYHLDLIEAASDLSQYTPIILDRWAPSEAVYGPIFRKEAAYDTEAVIKEWEKYILFIFCHHKDVEANHQKHREERYEMFETMEGVQSGFNKWFDDHAFDIRYLDYDFSVSGSGPNLEKFIKKVKKEMKDES